MNQTEEIRETTAGDVLRKPLPEQFESEADFLEALNLWDAARPA
jgi:hypothetical protein